MRFAVLVSGRGTNLQALLDAEARGELSPAELVVVLCNRPGAPAIERARTAGKPVLVVDHTEHHDRPDFERAMLAALEPHRVEGVVLAGFMRILTETFLDAFPMKVINTHPSLLPAFPGMHGARQAIEHGCKITGCTIHLVEWGVDSGPIVLQAPVVIEPDDSPESLQRRIQEQEHRLLPEAVRLMAAGELHIEDRRVRVG